MERLPQIFAQWPWSTLCKKLSQNSDIIADIVKSKCELILKTEKWWGILNIDWYIVVENHFWFQVTRVRRTQTMPLSKMSFWTVNQFGSPLNCEWVLLWVPVIEGKKSLGNACKTSWVLDQHWSQAPDWSDFELQAYDWAIQLFFTNHMLEVLKEFYKHHPLYVYVHVFDKVSSVRVSSVHMNL